MKLFYLFSLTLLAAASAVLAQNEDIPVETDNQFPPDHSESDGLIEGSGAEAEEPVLENIGSTLLKEMEAAADLDQNSKDETSSIGLGLTEFSASIDPKIESDNVNTKTSTPALESMETTSYKGMTATADISQIPENETSSIDHNLTELSASIDPKIESDDVTTITTSPPALESMETTSFKEMTATADITQNSENETSSIDHNLTELSSSTDPKIESDDVLSEKAPPPALENMETTSIKEIAAKVDISQNSEDENCPKPCVCSIEGDTDNYIVDCSNYGLTEFPAPIDPKTTTLNLNNNKLTEIPKEVSSLKKMKVLNANNNQIMELVAGSISELPELVTLKLANNRLIEYPKDLKNSISLIKLEELDLGGNDMRTSLTSELFSNFKALRKLTLPTESTPEFVLDLCGILTNTLETVCTESCNVKTFDCPDAPQKIDEDLLDVAIPGMISYNGNVEDNSDPSITTEVKNVEAESTESSAASKDIETTSVTQTKNEQSVNEFSLRSAVNNAAQEVSPLNNMEKTTKENQDEIKIGAKTSETTPGGVNKSVIGIIVAGMIIVVAIITIKKNWSSIKKRFSSSPRPNERTQNNANGTTPEEVPLKEKSPQDNLPV